MSLTVLEPSLAAKALKELNEKPDGRYKKINKLRAKTTERPDLKFDTTDKGLIIFLRARKFNVDKAFELMVRYYETKRSNPDIFENFNPSAERLTFQSGWNIAFPKRDSNGCRIFTICPGNWNPSDRSLINNFRANLIALEILIQEEETQINGLVIIIDFRNFGLTQAAAIQPTLFRRYGGFVFNTYPIRIKGIHVIEQPAIFSIIFPIISYFMKKKIKDRVKLHGSDMDNLSCFFSADSLPMEYGGTGEPNDFNAWVRYVINAEEELEHLWT
ncbi:alpha-tocopherol transfer protein-like [Hydra vulgaris]|uniref:alpha-tocopherol transfer protein-like n=1 Tax=Hydra vulgaris TaxID=6087 RepID=UPI0006413351|nr:alpha-tocopherol transfer protein-like [Hydra vulgaris]